MRFTHLDILEQCFHEKFRGYDKREVDTFLQLVATDLKEIEEEIKNLKAKVSDKNKLSKSPKKIGEVVKKIKSLKSDIDIKDRRIKELEKAQSKTSNARADNGKPLKKILPEVISNKARSIIRLAQEKAEQQKKKSTQELLKIQEEIKKLKGEKKHLLQNTKPGDKGSPKPSKGKVAAAKSGNASENKKS